MRVTTQNGRVLLHNEAETPVCDPHTISTGELRGLGVESVAYIRAIQVDGEDAFAIHAADGTPMAVTDDRETAVNAILQHEMMPVPLH
ncbi:MULTISPECIES: DUF1150 family protein [Komagataeibacter]|uniref:Uncharacterized protein n=2 Tax=Komagataeibacter saccharivorans TaxID=265959 RepID=A0A347W8U6_9PROT|nr:DUF1150 family protein [Komagataeibacter saccharivorans]AXY21289.1 hypothetical protein CD178_00471 [Komagataeibacter saccharivorans]PYD51273.1 hypothetical protein CFR79_05105 [Komagataeibacter saccharivorans]QBL94815.1 hypothetical protein KSAC_26280 [Komagataeibacter saccharivorans]GBQ37840.1 hypothetical protein AA0614_1160 [Komagataeibacter saccharivorans NRIC 0614]